MSESKQQLPQEMIYGRYAEDEISLIDLWLVIKRRKKLVFYTVFFFTVLSLLFAFLKTDQYQYKTTIEIGVKVVNGEFKKIESPDTVLAKLNESYIPLVLSEYVKKNDPEYKVKLEIKARIPKGSEIIVLESKGSKGVGIIYTQLLGQVVKKINLDHQRIVNLTKKNIDVELNQLSSQVLAYNDEINLLVSKLKRQDAVASLIRQEVNEADGILKSAIKNKQKAINEAGSETKALTLMLLNSEIRKSQEALAKLKERLYVELSESKEEINNKIKDIKRGIESIADQKSKLNLEENSIRGTNALMLPMRSLDVVGMGRRLIVILGFISGLFFGMVFVFFAEFLGKVRDAEK